MPAPTVTPLPAAPLRSETPSQFTTSAEAFVNALEALPGEINAVAAYVDEQAVAVDASVAAAEAAADTAAADVAAAIAADKAAAAASATEANTAAGNASAAISAGINGSGTATVTGASSAPSGLTLTGAIASAAIIVYNTAFAVTGQTLIAEIKANAAGAVTLYAYSKSGDDLTALGSVSVWCAAGSNTFVIDSSRLPLTGTYYLGWAGKSVVGTVAGSSATPFWASAANPTSANFTDTTTATTPNYAVRFTTMEGRYRVNELQARVAALLPVAEATVAGAPTFVGVSGTVTTQWRVDPRAYPRGGILESVDIHLNSASVAPTIYSYTVSGGAITVFDSVALAPRAVGEYLAVPVNLEIPAGGMVGVYTAGLSQTAAVWPQGYYGNNGGSAWTLGTLLSVSGAAIRFNVREFIAGSMASFRNALTLAGVSSGTTVAAGASRALVVAESLLDRAHLFLGFTGQSPIVGTVAGVSTRQRYGAKTFTLNSTTIINALVPTAGTNEYCGFAAADYLRERIMDQGGPSNISGTSPITVGRCGASGVPLTSIIKGTGAYSNGQGQLTAAKTAAGSSPFIHLGTCLYQGHGDQVAGTAKATYKATLLQFGIDYDTDSRATVAGSDLRRVYVVQVCSGLSYGASQAAAWDITQAQREACNESDYLSMIGPDYFFAYADDRHPAALGDRLLGAYVSRATLSRRKWQPLQVVDQYISGNNIVLVYNRDNLALDTELVAPQANSGFTVMNGSAVAQTINSVSVSGRNVTLAMAATPATGWKAYYGNILATGMGTYAGGAGNLRDSAGDIDTFDGHALHNWAVLQEVTL